MNRPYRATLAQIPCGIEGLDPLKSTQDFSKKVKKSAPYKLILVWTACLENPANQPSVLQYSRNMLNSLK